MIHSSRSPAYQPESWRDAVGPSDDAVWEIVNRAMRSLVSRPKTVRGRRITVGDSAFEAQILDARAAGSAAPVLVLLFSEAEVELPPAAFLQGTFRLTPRESEVALLLAQRKTNKEIARELDVTHFTAERHTERVLGKLGISSRRQVRAAIMQSTTGAVAPRQGIGENSQFAPAP